MTLNAKDSPVQLIARVSVWPVAALASLGYEKTCVLFNAAALASQIAAEQNLDNDEGLKAAAKYYQVGKQPQRGRLQRGRLAIHWIVVCLVRLTGDSPDGTRVVLPPLKTDPSKPEKRVRLRRRERS